MTFQFSGLYDLIVKNKDIIFNKHDCIDINGCRYRYKNNIVVMESDIGENYGLIEGDKIFLLDNYELDSLELTHNLSLVKAFIELIVDNKRYNEVILE